MSMTEAISFARLFVVYALKKRCYDETMSTERSPIDISFSAILKVAAVVLGLFFLYLIKGVLAMLFLAIIIASAADPIISFLERKYFVPRLLGAFVLYLVLFGALGIIFYFLVPPIVDELKQFAVVFPDYFDSVSKELFRTTRGISPDWAKDLQGFLINMGDNIRNFTSGITQIISGLFGGMVTFTVVIVTSFYLAAQRRGVEDFLRIVTPQEEEVYVLGLWRRVETKLGRWFQGQVLLGLIVGAIVLIGLSIIGVPYALLLAVVAGLFEILPIVGPLFSALLGITIAALVSFPLAMLTAILYFIVQQVENHALVPLLMKRVTGLNPVVVIVALLIGAQLGGIFGMLLSVPMATVVSEVIEDFTKKKSAAA